MTKDAQTKLDALVNRVRTVRLWLAVLAILKVAALCLVFVSVYIGVYAWLDHKLRFGEISRIVAFIVLVTGVAFLLYRLARLLVRHISCSSAANYVESKINFGQQLVTAVEYYENRRDYPYSQTLAERLVLNVYDDSAGLKFDSTVPKGLAYVFAVAIVVGLGLTGLYVRDNYIYFAAYIGRLVRPLAAVEPLPATTLESLTKDITAEPGSTLTMAARIKGLVPEEGKLILAGAEPNGAEGGLREVFTVRPEPDKEGKPKLEAARIFPEASRLKYRFEAGQAQSPWHNIKVCTVPGIKSITAHVAPTNNRYIQPYTRDVNDFALEVVEDSLVTLDIEATESLSGAVVTDLYKKAEAQKLTDSNTFDYKFAAAREGFIGFELVSAEGVANKNIPALHVTIKVDEPPKFKLLSPDGDYLATNVASVPLTFEVSDDFGLESVTLDLEMPGAKTEVLTIPIDKGAKSTTFTNTIELERYDLAVGDSIMFSAKARDIAAQTGLTRPVSSSDIYFIEVRPYRQMWHQRPPMLPGGVGKQGLEGDIQPIEVLKSILEYTRAIIKKTWVIAAKPKLAEEDRTRLGFINKDVQYCHKHVTAIREKLKSDAKVGDGLTEVLGHYDKAGKYLTLYDAPSAIEPEKDAYRILRKLVLELDKKPPDPGSGSTPKTPDKVVMEEQVHLTRYDKERIDWELDRLAQKLARLIAEQKRLREDFENFLQQQAKKMAGQETTDEESWLARHEKPSEGRPCSNCGSEKPGGCPVCTTATVDGALKPPPKTPAPGEGQGMGQGQGQSGRTASMQDRMKMLEAKQRALKAEVSRLNASLQALPKAPDAEQNKETKNRELAKEHLDEATAEMNSFEEKLAQAYYNATEADEKRLSEAGKALVQAGYELELAREALEGAVTLSKEQLLARNAERLARELTRLADDLDESVKDAERQEMLARLEQAKQALEQMQNQLAAMQNASGAKGATGRSGQGGDGSERSGKYTSSSGPASPGSVGLSAQSPAIMARIMASEFWSIAIKARKHSGQLIKDEMSAARFYEIESEFFESAAKFEGPGSGNRLPAGRPSK